MIALLATSIFSAVQVPLDLSAPATVQLLPAVTAPYMVSPDSSNFFIDTTGQLVVDTGLELDDTRDYAVTSSDFNGTFIVQLIANAGEIPGCTCCMGKCSTVSGTLQYDYRVYSSLAVGGFVVSAPTAAEAVLGEALVIEVVTGGSSSALRFVWKKDGVILSDSDRIQGASSSSLSISEVTLSDIGLYEFIPSNEDGSFNSSVTQVNIRSKLAVESECCA